MSTPEFDAVMNKMDLHDRTFKLAKSWGATDELAEVFAASQSVKFKWDGVVLSCNGKNAADDPETKRHFTEGALKPLFPTAAVENAPKIPPELLASAKAGNLTSRGAMLRLLGSLEAVDAALATLVNDIERSKFAFPQNVTDVVAAAIHKTGAGYPNLLRDLFKYLSNLKERGAKPNREAQFVGRFAKAYAAAQDDFKKSGMLIKEGRISCAFPPGGIQDNTVNRLLLMSSSERHLSGVPMAFFIEPADELLVAAKGSLSP